MIFQLLNMHERVLSEVAPVTFVRLCLVVG